MHNEDVETISQASIHSRQYYVKKMCLENVLEYKNKIE